MPHPITEYILEMATSFTTLFFGRLATLLIHTSTRIRFKIGTTLSQSSIVCPERTGRQRRQTLRHDAPRQLACLYISICPLAYADHISRISSCLESSKTLCSLSTSSENSVEVSWAEVTASWSC